MRQIPEKLENRIIRRVLFRVLLCLALYAVFFYAFVYRYSYSYYAERIGEILTVMIYTAIIILPYFVSGIHGFIMDKSFEGTVVKIRRTRELKPWRGGANVGYSNFVREQCITVRATVRLDNGEVIDRLIRRYDIDDLAQSLCQVGDRVRHVKGAPFTQIYGVGKRHDVDCVWCGAYIDKRNKSCNKCGSPLLHWVDVKPLKNEEGIPLREALREEEPNVRVPRYTGPTVVDTSEVHDTVSYSQKPTRAAEDKELELGEVTPTPEFGTYKRSVDPYDFLGLLGVSLAGMAVAGYISFLVTGMLENHADKWIFAVIFAGIIPTAISVYYMRSYPSNHYRRSGRFPAWLMQASFFILPAETVRLLISALRLFGTIAGWLFSPLSYQWWYLYHMLPSERLTELENGIFIAEDYGAYFAVAVPAMLLRVVILFAAYYYFWRQYEREREIMFNERSGRV